jgi:hypothetical protein
VLLAVCRLTELYLIAIVVEIESRKLAMIQRPALRISIDAYMTISLPFFLFRVVNRKFHKNFSKKEIIYRKNLFKKCSVVK